MIKAIEIENFKSFKNRELIEFKDLTLFSGVNGSGKSSIAQIISLIGDSVLPYLYSRVPPKKFPYLQLNLSDIELGNANELLNETNKPLHVGFYYDDTTYLGLDFLLEQGDPGDESQSEDRVYLNLINFSFDNVKNSQGEEFSICAKRYSSGWKITAKSCCNFYDDSIGNYIYKYVQNKFGDDKFSPIVEFNSIKDINFLAFAPYIFKIPSKSIINCIRKEYRNDFNYSDFINDAKKNNKKLDSKIEMIFIGRKYLDKYLSQISKSEYIEPFRGKALRIYSQDKNPLLIIKRNTQKIIKYNYDFENNKVLETTWENAFAYWIKKLNLAEKVEINEIIQDSVSETFLIKDNKRISINNDGFGISQILPLIANCIFFTERLIIVDEPEVHLHPGLQAKIGEFLFIMSKLGRRIIIETHSECIINQIKYLTLCHEEMRENVISYWIEKGTDSSKVRTIEYDEYGFVENPPEGFFDETEKILKKIRELRQIKFYGTKNLK